MQQSTCKYPDLNHNLLEQFNKREEDAFCFVYEHFYNELYYFASKLFLDNTVLPYDVLQDIFLNVLENKKQFESFDLLKSYLYLSIRNRWKNEHKHKEDNILSNIFESETLAILYNHLKLLPPECAKVMRLSLEGHKNPEIAEILSISINTVYAQKQKALTVLRNKLSKDMFVILLFSLFLHGE